MPWRCVRCLTIIMTRVDPPLMPRDLRERRTLMGVRNYDATIQDRRAPRFLSG
jgi:hypothetical protein